VALGAVFRVEGAAVRTGGPILREERRDDESGEDQDQGEEQRGGSHAAILSGRDDFGLILTAGLEFDW
jgi:hypothetical protein